MYAATCLAEVPIPNSTKHALIVQRLGLIVDFRYGIGPIVASPIPVIMDPIMEKINRRDGYLSHALPQSKAQKAYDAPRATNMRLVCMILSDI